VWVSKDWTQTTVCKREKGARWGSDDDVRSDRGEARKKEKREGKIAHQHGAAKSAKAQASRLERIVLGPSGNEVSAGATARRIPTGQYLVVQAGTCMYSSGVCLPHLAGRDPKRTGSALMNSPYTLCSHVQPHGLRFETSSACASERIKSFRIPYRAVWSVNAFSSLGFCDLWYQSISLSNF